MGRLYSGNLNEYKSACYALALRGFPVKCDEGYDHKARQYIMWLTIQFSDGSELISQKFTHSDEDCLYNAASSWLRKMCLQLEGWQ